MKSLVWFRNDLRIYDNPALKAACQNASNVSAVFIFSQKIKTFTKLALLTTFVFFISNSLRSAWPLWTWHFFFLAITCNTNHMQSIQFHGKQKSGEVDLVCNYNTNSTHFC